MSVARVLCTVPPLVGHLNPALDVMAVLAERGHGIAWAVHLERIGRYLPADARVYPLDGWAGMVSNEWEREVRGLESLRYFYEQYSVRMTRASFASLEAAVLDFRPDVVVVDQHMTAGALVARKHRLPWITLATTSAAILESSPQFEDWVRQHLRELQEGFLPPELHAPRPDLSPHGVIVFSIEALATAAGRRPMVPCTFVGPAGGTRRPAVEFPWEWLKPGLPLILVTLGTVSRDVGSRFFEVVFEAASGLELQAVVVAPTELADRAPPNVLVRPFVPQVELIRRAAAVICHGGQNTVCEALAEGLPLAVAPIRSDQPYVASQVVAAGAGIQLRFGKVTVPVMREAIERLLRDEELRSAAARLAEAMRAAPGVEGAADLVEAVAAGAAASPTAEG